MVKGKKREMHFLANSKMLVLAKLKKAIKYNFWSICILHIFITYKWLFFFQETAEANVLFSFIRESAQTGALHDKMEEQSKESINCKCGSRHWFYKTR